MTIDARRSFHHGNLREALVRAAIGIVERQGSSSVSLREVARASGVSHNAPYRHFPTREALLAAVAERGFDQLRSELAAATSAGSTDRLLALGAAYVSFATARTGLFRLMFEGNPDRSQFPSLEASAGRTFALLQEAMVANGAEHPREAALGAWAFVHGLSHLAIAGQLAPDIMGGRFSTLALERIARAYSEYSWQWRTSAR